jgi:hypothetical protein
MAGEPVATAAPSSTVPTEFPESTDNPYLDRRTWLKAAGTAAVAVAALSGPAAAAPPIVERGGPRTVSRNAAGEYVVPSGEWEVVAPLVGTVVIDGNDVSIFDPAPSGLDATGRTYGVVNRGFDGMLLDEFDVTGGDVGIFVRNATDPDVTQSLVFGSETAGIQMIDCTGARVDETFIGPTSGNGLVFDRCTDSGARASGTRNNGGVGTLVVNCNDIGFFEYASVANGGDGIRVVRSSNVGVTEFVRGNGGHGISLDRVENFSFEGPVLGNAGDGARVVRSSDVLFGSLFESDAIADNDGSGVGIYDSELVRVVQLGNTFFCDDPEVGVENGVEGNGNYGILIADSEDVTLEDIVYGENTPDDVYVGSAAAPGILRPIRVPIRFPVPRRGEPDLPDQPGIRPPRRRIPSIEQEPDQEQEQEQEQDGDSSGSARGRGR